MSEKRGPWYLITGLILGVGLGILLAWVVLPAPYTPSAPANLRSDFKDQYRYQIASAYAATGNLERARARLAVVLDADPLKALGEQAQRLLAHQVSMEAVSPLADLGEALQANPVPAIYSTVTGAPPGDSPTPSAPLTEPSALPGISPTAGRAADTPAPSLTPDPFTVPTLAEPITPLPTAMLNPVLLPTRIPTATPGTPFELANQATFCDPAQPGLLQIVMLNSGGQPAPGVELVITWVGGGEHFFTGLKPELGYGYADFVMSAGVEYVLSAGGSARITGIIPSPCAAADGSTYPGGIRLEFKQP